MDTQREASEKMEQAHTEPLAAQGNQNENVQEEHVETEEHQDDDHHDFSGASKEDLLKALDGISQSNDFKKVDSLLKALRPAMDEIKDAERQAGLDRFLADGGIEEDFDFKFDEQIEKFDAIYRLLKDRKSKHYAELEKQKDKNLAHKLEVLEKLRALVDSEESNASINAFKKIQEEWKSIGQVPSSQVRTLWANYNALVDRFYDNRSIYFELKELDRKKNLQAKQEICAKAEALSAEPDVKEAIKTLNELHEEFRHIGPVPKEEQEQLWQKFKAASDQVYDRRKGYLDVLKTEMVQNLALKTALTEKLPAFVEFKSDRINDWNTKTKEMLAIQKEWDAIGSVPKENAKEINKKFWQGFKQFFHNKNDFFKNLEALRQENLNKKKELVEKAKALSESHEWDKAANALKNLQQQWKTLGPVPEKFRDSIYQEFKAACDEFFNNLRNKNAEENKEFDVNLKNKEAVIAKIQTLASAKSSDTDQLTQFIAEFKAIGFVPRNAMKSIQQKFNQATEAFITNAQELDEINKERLRLNIELGFSGIDPGAKRKLMGKENDIRRKIKEMEDNIALWNNNLAFFANSKTADKLKVEFDEKIAKTEQQLSALKEQLRLLRSIE